MAKKKTAAKGFTADERAAMKDRVRELKGKGDGESDVLAAITRMQAATATKVLRIPLY